MAEIPSADQLIAGLPDALLIIDQEHKVEQVNPAAENLLGNSAKNLVGQPVHEIIEFEDDRLQDALRDTDANMAARRMSVQSKGRDIGKVDFNIQNVPASPRWRMLSLSRLPTDSPVQDREAEDSNSSAVRAPDILGHEIKNPLAAIKGAAQLLERNLDEEQKSLSGMIKSEVERITSLLDRMQSLSSNQPAKIEPVNIHALIDRARESVETAFDGELSIRDVFDPSLPDVLVDPDAMMQILTNLLVNAAEATKNIDDPEIEVTTRYSFGASFAAHGKKSAARLPVEIIVKDNGPGVPQDLEGEIFSPFVSTKTEGQGLGLALVRKLLSDIGGRIRYERNTKQEHSLFILFLPIADKE